MIFLDKWAFIRGQKGLQTSWEFLYRESFLSHFSPFIKKSEIKPPKVGLDWKKSILSLCFQFLALNSDHFKAKKLPFFLKIENIRSSKLQVNLLVVPYLSHFHPWYGKYLFISQIPRYNCQNFTSIGCIQHFSKFFRPFQGRSILAFP